VGQAETPEKTAFNLNGMTVLEWFREKYPKEKRIFMA
jgi:hypothetical protein